MMVFTMVSTMKFSVKEGVMEQENFDFQEAIKNGNIEISIPELSFVDPDGQEIIEGDEKSGIIGVLMDTLKGEKA